MHTTKATHRNAQKSAVSASTRKAVVVSRKRKKKKNAEEERNVIQIILR